MFHLLQAYVMIAMVGPFYHYYKMNMCMFVYSTFLHTLLSLRTFYSASSSSSTCEFCLNRFIAVSV